MKKLLFLLLLACLSPANTHAQNWFQSDYHWITHVSGGLAGFDYNFELFFEADTTIHGLPCKKWQTVSNSPHWFYFEPVFTYSDGPRAYCYDSQLDSLVKIYDFSLPVGAQLQIPQPFGVFTYQIDSLDMVQAGDFQLMRQRVHYVNPNGQPVDWKFDILENIGMVGLPFDQPYNNCSFVLIPRLQCGSAVDGIDYAFKCFNSNSGSFHPYNNACMLTDTHSPTTPYLYIFPTLAHDEFRIITDANRQDIRSLELHDATGRLMRTWSVDRLSYDIQDMPQGMYFVCLRMKNGIQVVKKLVRE